MILPGMNLCAVSYRSFLVDLIGWGTVPVPCLWCDAVGVDGVFVDNVARWPDEGEGVAGLGMLAKRPREIYPLVGGNVV